MAQTIKLKRSSVSGNTPGTSDLELGEVAINTYDGKMFIKKNDGSDSIVEIGGTSGTVTEAFKTIAVSGQSSVVADSATDTLTLVAGSNMTITTNASGDTITFASSGGGGTQNVFSTFAVSGQSSVVADSTTDTLTLAAGSGINITTNAGTDTITIAATASAITVQDEGSALSTSATTLNFVGAGVTASGTGATKTITISGGGGSQNLFSNIGVSGQGTIQADSTTDTLTFEAGTGISLTTDTTNDKLTITATGGTSNVANAASSIKEFKYDITSSTTTITGSDANSNTLAYEAGAIQVFLNGILLDPATDYTASNGTSVVLTDAAVSGDDVQIVSFNRKIVTANVGLSTFTGDGSTTAFTLSSDPVHENNTRVHIDGVYQEKAAYSVSGTTLTFSGAPPNGSSIEVEIGFTQAEIGSTLDFADNAILRIGTGNDLQILHDGSNSIIKDTGTGDLQIAASTLEVKNSGLSETMIKAIEDGAVELYHDNAKKLETVTGGVTITGTATATTFSGDLSGTINTATTGTTQSASDNSTKIATTAYVDTAVTNLVDSAPGTLNTLNELAAALGDDANFSTTITNSLATKVGLTATTGAANIPAGTTGQRPGSPAAGQFRYNSTLNQFEGYTSSWGAIGGGGTNTFTTDVFTSSGSAAFTLTQAVASPNDCIVHIDGIYQTPTDAYTVSGTTLTFTSTPASGRKIVVYSVKAGVSGNNLNIQTFSGNGSTTSFTMNINPINENNTIVHIDGVYQQKTSYSTSGTTISFSAAPANGTTIEVATFTQTEINVPVNDTIDTVHIKDDAVTSAKLGGNLVAPGTVTASAGFVGPLTGNVTGTIQTAAQTNITSVGTLTGLALSGNITTGGITINGASSVISDSSDLGIVSGGDLTIDVTGDINLDADGSQVYIKHAGTERFRFELDATPELATTGGNFRLRNDTSDADILFIGNDGGSNVTALTLDMSAAGAATFNSSVTSSGLTVNGAAQIGSAATKVNFYSDSTYSGIYNGSSLTSDESLYMGGDALFFYAANAERLRVNSSGISVTGNVTANPSGGVITLGANGHITSKQSLDVITAGGRYMGSSNRGLLGQMRIEQTAQGADGGYIALDTSAVGSTSPTQRMLITSGGNVGIGITNPGSYSSAAYDLVVGGSGSQGITVVSGTGNTGNLFFADSTVGQNAYRGYVQYQHNGDKLVLGASSDDRVFITSTGLGIGNNSPDYKLHISGTGSTRALIENTDTNWAALDIRAGGNQADYIFFKDDSAERARIQVTDNNDFIILTGNSPATRLTIADNGYLTLGASGRLYFPDGGIALFGGGSDLKISHDGSSHHSTIEHVNTNGALKLKTPEIRLEDASGYNRYKIASNNRHFFYGMNGGSNFSVGSWAFGHTGDGSSNGYLSSWTTTFGQRIHLRTNAGSNQTARGTVSFTGSGDNNFRIMQNVGYNGVYWNASTQSGRGTVYEMDNGSHYWTNTSSVASGSQYAVTYRMQLNTSGNLYITGTLTQSTTISDARLKQDIEEFPSALEKMKALRTVKFNWIDEERRGEHKEIGLIAQEVKEIYPELIGTTDAIDAKEDPETLEKIPGEERYMMHYEKLTVVLLKAMQEQQELIETLQAKVAALEAK